MCATKQCRSGTGSANAQEQVADQAGEEHGSSTLQHAANDENDPSLGESDRYTEPSAGS
jgi:hypothetical protein